MGPAPKRQREVPVAARGKAQTGPAVVGVRHRVQRDPHGDHAVGVKGRHVQVAVPACGAVAHALEEHGVLCSRSAQEA